MSTLGSLNAAVLKYITDRPGQIVYLDDITNDLGMESDIIRRTISNIKATARAKAKEEEYHPFHDLTDVVRGNSWSYRPNVGTTPIFSDTPKHKTIGVPKTTADLQAEPLPKPTARPKGRTFTYHGKTASGEVVISDENEILFKVVPL